MSNLRAPASWDVSTLNTFIAQQENYLRGPLVAIKGDGDDLILEIDDKSSDEAPKKNTVVTIGAPPPGARVIGSAQIYSRGSPVTAIAYRPE